MSDSDAGLAFGNPLYDNWRERFPALGFLEPVGREVTAIRGTVVHYLLFYDVVEGYAERRKPYRSAHLAHALQAVARNELILGGALANPVDGAVLLCRGCSPSVAESFAATDPYVLNGLVRNWRVREWTTVVGADAAVAPGDPPA